MVLYWLSYNVFTMGQQIYMLRRYHQPLAAIDAEHVVTDPLPSEENAKPALPGDALTAENANPDGGRRRRRRKKKKGS
jgi:membrane protein insertase Oxa1/YidC/SpoIIIJ